MSLPVSVFVGLRYARASKGSPFIAFINMFSVVGIALGLTALIVVASVMNGFEGQLKTRLLGITPHLVVDTQDAFDGHEATLAAIEGVSAQSLFIEAEGVVQSRRGLQGVLLHGVDPQFMSEHSVLSQHFLVGEFNQLTPGQYQVIISRALAAQLNLKPGDQTRLISASSSTYTPFGRMPSQRLFTVVGLFDLGSQMDDKVVYLHINDAAKLMRKPISGVAKTRLFLDDAFDYQYVQQRIDLPSTNWRVRQGPLFDAVKMEKNMMSLMLLLIIAVAAFNIVSALVMVVTEKQGDIAILRTQGMTGRAILNIFLINGLHNGIKGTLLGLTFGLIVVTQLNDILSLMKVSIAVGDGRGLPIQIDWLQIITMVFLSIGLCFVATLYPSYLALRVNPAQALKYE